MISICSFRRYQAYLPWRFLTGTRAEPRSAAIVLVTIASLTIASFLSSRDVEARELIRTGTFDGDLDPWQSISQSLFVGEDARGEWFLDSVGSFTPFSFQATTTEGLAEGNYAVSDQIDKDANLRGGNESVLFQVFRVPENPRSVVLSFDMFVNDWSSRSGFNPLQHGRVDIISADADPFDVEGAVIANLYLGTDGGPLPNPFRRYEFELAPFVTGGGEFAIRFYHINEFETFNMGVDNVSISYVPEPHAFGMTIVSFLSLGAWCHTRRRRVNP